MNRRFRQTDDCEELNIWPAFTDLMSNAFMILLLFLLIVIVKSVLSARNLEPLLISLAGNKHQVADYARKIEILQAKVNKTEQLEQQVASLQKQLHSAKQLTDTPPIILIKDEGAYRFESGSAELPQPMYKYVWTKIVPEIEQKTKEYNINTVEIIGHTDGQANGGTISNLDQNLENVATGSLPVRNLKAGSNADLGLMRSLELVRVLRYIQTKEGRLKGLKFRAYSAAQLILPSGEFALPTSAQQEDSTRRRIEIRFTRLGEVTEVK
ncbi:flagellar motor protein [Scytonema sp. UIC 10036]|uniref:flagellar motor protein n=1 Tax=Scytonema sp. UIC 10036 TaxID=2304196 RepID=UPI0012DAADC7|nr:flagellar motor protein [Scytonema sp. UIC 10036]MUH00481.1 flagellar motor protein [Scytonema sp. UIC 10036]